MNAPDFSLAPIETPEAARSTTAARTCPRCHCVRQATDTAPAWQCPRCEVAYDKVQAQPTAPRTAGGRPKSDDAPAYRPAPPRERPWGLIAMAGTAALVTALMGWKWSHDKDKAAERAARAESEARAQQVAVEREDLDQKARLAAAESQWRRNQGLAALPTVRAMATQGDVRAMVLLSAMLNDGYDIPKDHAESMQWLTKAANLGSGLAAVRLGAIYELGLDEPRQMSLAENWFLRAARQGYPAGLYSLGALYARGGDMVSQRPIPAYMLLELANRASAGQPSEDMLTPPRHGAFWASGTLNKLATTMPPADIAEARRRADAWKPGQPLEL
ncbi:tetratricopeptide repeat protein [Acidovorax sp. SUPP3334]|uniref:tetratricopeptide repeat protein n=1 Tax=Acidovorax sp. SUPP3334 TaxID=2920881 RepID=UPI0023DE4139|nr:tetratricopeptide repeat protein [Acidovorax sp. SUPP3334]GKT21080.1 sel1 repeat family protein [Acidovorax sp. SUPP3334]